MPGSQPGVAARRCSASGGQVAVGTSAPPSDTHTCAHSAPVPSASSRAIRSGRSSAGSSALTTAENLRSASYGAGPALLHDPGGEPLEPAEHRVEAEGDDGRGQHREAERGRPRVAGERTRRRRPPRGRSAPRRRGARRRRRRPRATRAASGAAASASTSASEQCARSAARAGGSQPPAGGWGQPPGATRATGRPGPAVVRPARSSATPRSRCARPVPPEIRAGHSRGEPR